MRPIFVLLLLFGLAACQSESDPCPVLLEKRELALKNSLDSLLFHRDEMQDDSFRLGMQVLRKWELILLYDARHCNFEQDPTRGYYWQLGRLKYPGKIQKTMEKYNIPQPPVPAK